jgi:hypothetical protein
LDWPFPPGLLSILLLWVGWSWWKEIFAQTEAAAMTAAGAAPAALVWLGLGARGLATLTEAAVYVLWWKSHGARLRYWRFAAWIAALSAADLFGFALGRAAQHAPDVVRILCAILAGPLAGGDPWVVASGAMAAFGNLGLLTLLRIGVTAWAQARGTGRSPGGALVVTGHAWLLTRLATWWSFDLLRGMSPVR